MKLTKWLVLTTLALATAMLPASAKGARFAGAKWHRLDVSRVMAAAASITRARHPNCDTVVVDENSVRDYRVNGTAECQDETFTKILTEKGKRRNREIQMYFQLPYSTVSVPLLEIIRPNGTRVPVNVPANSKVTIDTSQMAANIYDPNDRVLSVNIPHVHVGDVVHVISREVVHRSIMPDEFDDATVFEGTSYIRHWSYRVYAPAKLPLVSVGLRDQVRGTVTSSRRRSGDRIVYDWEVRNVPRMFREPDMPPADQVLQRLFVSTVPSWRDVSRWYWKLSLPHLEQTRPDMAREVAALTKNQPTAMDKVKALFSWVSRNIRYMGVTPEKNRPGWEPHDVDITFTKKYGVCRDKAALLVSMLRLAGFKAYPVLINIGAKRDPKVPQPFFDHAIVAVALTPGHYTLMDPTDENTRSLLPSYDCNRSYLVCTPKGDSLRVSPVLSVSGQMLLVRTRGTLDANGTLAATTEISFDGVNDDAYRNAFARWRPDERRRFFEARLKQAIPGLRLSSLSITPHNVRDTSHPLRVKLKFTASGLTANGGGRSVVCLPWVARHLGVANFILGGAVGLKKRKYPLETQYTCGVREQMTLRLKGFRAPLALPKFASLNSPAVVCDESVSLSHGVLRGSRLFELKKVEFSPAQYLQLRHALRDKATNRRRRLILALGSRYVAEAQPPTLASAEAPESANARILSSQHTLTVKDAHTAILRVKYSKLILSYKGKARESEVKISYNPACEKVKLIHAVTISPHGRRQEISPDEVNVMDQSWDARATRYTAGRVLVASLPGVEIGSRIEVEYEVIMHDVPYISSYEAFQFTQPLDHKRFQLTAPAGLKVHALVTGAPGVVKAHTHTAGGKTTMAWWANRVAALPSEQDLPPTWSYRDGLQYFVGNPRAYWKALNAAMLSHSERCSAAAALARRLTATARTPQARVRIIRDYIARNIRQAGPSFRTLPLSELSDADTTLADGYGHAADRAILFCAMLRAIGLRPEFVLASNLPPAGLDGIVRTCPLPDEFKAPLVLVSIGGHDEYFNDGDQYSKLGTTAYDGRMGLLLTNGELVTIRAAKGCADKVVSDYDVKLSANGHARIRIVREYYGQDYNRMHKFFAEQTPEKRKHYFQEAVSRVSQDASAIDGLQTDFATYPGREQFTVEMDDFGILAGRFLYLGLPVKPFVFGVHAQQRTLPLLLGENGTEVIRTTVHLPHGWRPSAVAPRSERFIAPGGSRVQVTKAAGKGRFTITETFTARPGAIAAKDYPRLLGIEAALGGRSENTLLLERDNTDLSLKARPASPDGR